MSPQQQRLIDLVAQAGASGIRSPELAVALNTTPRVLNQQTTKARSKGAELFVSWRPDGGIYFAGEADKMVSDAEWREHVKGTAKVRSDRNRDRRAALMRAKRAAEKAAKALLPKPPRKKREVKPGKKPAAVRVRAARQPLPIVKQVPVYEPVVTSKTKVTIAPAFVDKRWLPEVVRSVVNAQDCRAWARAATGQSA